ncbi:MAG: coproporphyrinogen-III oxidase family protein [Gemmataceae bacterium]
MNSTDHEATGLGNYFVANYPPFSFWKPEYLSAGYEALDQAPAANTPLGLYLHIPFCRKRCKFCYFRVYTDKNADQVATYTDALLREVELYSRKPAVEGRPLEFVYFGGGTPSYLSATQLGRLMTRLQKIMPYESAREVTFECEPGTLQLHKLQALKELGVTRLSLGIENFSDAILEANGRAHLSAEIHRSYGWSRDCGFEQINIDLIAGMLGETWDNWRDVIRKTIELAPESVTIYQMELPFNTVFSKELRDQGGKRQELNVIQPSFEVADWPTKRAWVAYGFEELAAAGYQRSSAYTMTRGDAQPKPEFVYRDSLWHGADMLGTGVASFGHVHGVHLQNHDQWADYLRSLLEENELPLHRALPVTRRQLLIREMILQLKTGRLDADYFRRKFDSDIQRDFAAGWKSLRTKGLIEADDGEIRLTDEGFLQVDRHLPVFFEPEHVGARYT